MFFVPACKNPNTPNGFFQEFLHHSYNQHRAVLAALADLMDVLASDEQLSGLGFSTPNTVTLRVTTGSKTRVIKVEIGE